VEVIQVDSFAEPKIPRCRSPTHRSGVPIFLAVSCHGLRLREVSEPCEWKVKMEAGIKANY
jgi:hypothetical protein